MWLMNGGQINHGFDLGVIGASWRPFTGDFDGDGKSDLLWRDDAGHTALWEMDGGQIKQGVDVSGISPGAGWDVAAVEDFDGDGKSDIFWRDGAGHSCIWEMDGGQIKQGIDLTGISPGAGWNVANDRSPV